MDNRNTDKQNIRSIIINKNNIYIYEDNPTICPGDLCPEPANYEFMFHNITEGSGGDDASGSFTTSVTELSPVTCRENFVLINSTCHPICHLWEQNTHAVGLTLRTIGNITGSMGLIIGLSAMVISFIDRKRMWESIHACYRWWMSVVYSSIEVQVSFGVSRISQYWILHLW